MPQAFYILLGAALTVATSLAIGKLLLRALPIELYRTEEGVLAFVVGASCLSLLVFLIAAAGLAYESVFVAVALLALAAAYLRGAHRGLPKALPPLPGIADWARDRSGAIFEALFVVIFAAFTFLYFINAMAPEMSPDGAAYHLGLVAQYLREHGLSRITTNIYASFPQGIEMLFLFAFSMGRHSSAALVHFAFLLALALAIVSYARRFGFPLAGLVGALFVYCSPVLGKDASCAYNDAATACIVFSLFYLLQIWEENRAAAMMVPIGLVAGFAYATKYTAFPAILYALAFVGWKQFRARGPVLRPLCIAGLCAFVMVAPWLLKNWIVVQNPFSPFLNAFFPNPHFSISSEEGLRGLFRYDSSLFRNAGLKGWREIAWEVTVHGGILAGIVGPLFLLSPLALLGLPKRVSRQLLLAAAVFAATYPSNIFTRFLIPALPFVALAMAIVFVRWKYIAALLVLVHAISSWPSVMARFAPHAWRIETIPVRAALRIEGEDSYLRRVWWGYGVSQMIERCVPPGKRVLSFGGAPSAYTSREVLIFWESAFNSSMTEICWTAAGVGPEPDWLLTFRFTPQPLRAIRIVQTATGSDVWSISELRVFRGGSELPRSPRWLVSAHPFPWDVRLALDGNPLTRWRTGQSLFNGMFFQVDFGQPQPADSVVLECPRDQWGIRLKLEGQMPSGRWQLLADAPTATVRPPLAGLRRLAAQTIKKRGIDYLHTTTGSYGAADLAAKSKEYGITLVGRSGNDFLYRIDD
jgi:hypothetical protein